VRGLAYTPFVNRHGGEYQEDRHRTDKDKEDYNRTKKRPTDTSISLLLVFMIHAHHVRSALHIPRQYYPAFPRMELFFGVDEHEGVFLVIQSTNSLYTSHK
jgi:hypothetical protein